MINGKLRMNWHPLLSHISFVLKNNAKLEFSQNEVIVPRRSHTNYYRYRPQPHSKKQTWRKLLLFKRLNKFLSNYYLAGEACMYA
jgi:hypothetical protein